MTQRGRWIVLVLLVLTAVLPGWAEAPQLRPGQGLDIPWSKGPSGWMVWYEDETFEDCGPIMNEAVMKMDTELAKADRTSMKCLDVWQPALPRPVATEEACNRLLTRYNTSAEEFKCSRERPEPQNDD